MCMSVYIVQGWDMETQRGNVCFSGLCVYMTVCWWIVTAGNTNDRISCASVTQPAFLCASAFLFLVSESL